MGNVVVQLKANADTAKATIQQVREGLVTVKTGASDAGRALEQAFSGPALSGASEKLRGTALAAQQTSEWMRKATQSVNALTSEFQREDEMLGRLRGPMQQHQRDLQTLDDLLKKGTISTKEYDTWTMKLVDDMDRANKITPRAGASIAPKSPTFSAPTGGGGGAGGGGMFDEILSHAGPAGQLLSQFATSEVAAAAAAIELGKKLIEVGDHYIELSNNAERFADAQHSANAIVRDQLALAGDLHASLDETSAMYGRLRAGTEDLGLSYDKTIRLAKSLGEDVELSGRSIGEAEGVMTRLAFAMDNGGITGRELKSIMREFPAIADTWTTSLGKSSKTLITMANQGKLNINDLTNALINNGDAIDQRYSTRIETASQAWQHLKDEVTVTLGEMVKDSGAIPALTEGLKNLMEAAKAAGPTLKVLGAEIEGLSAAWEANTEVFKREVTFNGLLTMGSLTDVIAKKLKDDVAEGADAATASFIKFEMANNELLAVLRKMDPAEGGVIKFFYDWHMSTQQVENKITTLTASLKQLEETRHSIISSGGMQGGWEGYGRYNQVVDDEQMRIQRQLEDANLALGASTSSYGHIVEEVTKKHLDYTRALQDTKAAYNETNDALTKQLLAEKQAELYAEAEAKWMGQVKRAQEAITRAYIDGKISLDQYNASMSKIDAGAGTLSTQHKIMTELRGGAAAASHEMEVLVDLFKAGKISEMEYVAEAQKIESALPGFAQLEEIIKRDNAAYDEGIRKAQLYREMAQHGITAPGMTGLTGPSFYDAEREAVEDLARAKAEDAYWTKQMETNEKRYSDLVSQYAGPRDKYVDDLLKLNTAKHDGVLTDEKYDEMLTKLNNSFAQAITPAELYAKDIRDVKKQLDDGQISAEGYQLRISEITDKYAEHDSTKGFADGIKSITAAMDVATQTQKVMTEGFNGITNAITDMVTKGTTDVHAFVDKMLVELTKLLIFQGIMAAIGGGLPGQGGVGGPSAGLSTLLGLPGHAGGASWQVGGSGAPDSQIVAFRASPDEHVTVETPAQRTARIAQHGAAPKREGDVRIINVQDHRQAMLEALDSVEGERIFTNWLIKNQTTIRGHISR